MNKLLLVTSCLLFMISCKQTTSSEQSEMPDLSEFRKVEESTTKTNQTAKPVARKEAPIAKESKTPKAVSVSDKTEISSPPTKEATFVKTKPKTASKPKTATKPKTQAKPKVDKKPQIQFVEPVHEFGEITEGDIIKHEFTFKNTGKAELVIKSAKASCGCTNPSYPFIGIAPGETGFIGVTYNSVSKDGPQKPEVTIKTNVDDTSIVLYLSGVVLPKEETEEKKESEGN